MSKVRKIKAPNFGNEVHPHIITEYEKELIKFLCPIIQNKQLIKFYYSDISENFDDWRIVEPHLIGVRNTKEEKIWLSAWFLPTKVQMLQGHRQDWKNYILDDVKKIEVLEQRYNHTRQKYNPKDSRMKSIYCATVKKSNP